MVKSPRNRQDPTMESNYNPYEAAQQKFNQYQDNPNAPTIITDANTAPRIPDYKEQPITTKRANYNMKIVVVGDGGCGKTCLLSSYSMNEFPLLYVPTIFENTVVSLAAPSGKSIELALWDTAGQEEYERLRPLSYPGVDLLLICFALDNITSLQNIRDVWFQEVSHFCPGIPIILVGTKCDLQSRIDPEFPIQVASEIGAIGYIQCSAKTMYNVRTVFNFALNHYQRAIELQEQLEKTSSARKRMSRVLGGSNGGGSNGGASFGSPHSRNHSRNHSRSQSKGYHSRHGSVAPSPLLDQPLFEDSYVKDPYRNDEFAFTQDRKKKRCVIL